jgi:hypothetical protein
VSIPSSARGAAPAVEELADDRNCLNQSAPISCSRSFNVAVVGALPSSIRQSNAIHWRSEYRRNAQHHPRFGGATWRRRIAFIVAMVGVPPRSACVHRRDDWRSARLDSAEDILDASSRRSRRSSSSAQAHRGHRRRAAIFDSAEDILDSAEDILDSAEDILDSAEDILDSAEDILDSAEDILDSAEDIVDSAEDIEHGISRMEAEDAIDPIPRAIGACVRACVRTCVRSA